jgi:formylglycine-generating enzyme required for sulfatase activity
MEPESDKAERYPINWVTWYQAFAFCAWDGGWLPTEAEWEYAAGGGSEQRLYPWAGGEASDAVRLPANYVSNHNALPLAVGSEPLGNGKWGQSDLAGSVNEWVFDWYAESYVVPCDNCANMTPTVYTNINPPGQYRVVRGGSWADPYDVITARLRRHKTPSGKAGLRCARSTK